jgi:hypothetical protein
MTPADGSRAVLSSGWYSQCPADTTCEPWWLSVVLCPFTVGLGAGQEDEGVIAAVHQVIGPPHDAFETEEWEPVGTAPVHAPVGRLVEVRRSATVAFHANEQGEIGVREIQPAPEVGGPIFLQARGHDGVALAARPFERSGRPRGLDRPCLTTVAAPGEQEVLGFGPVEVVIIGAPFAEGPATEGHEELVAPRPGPMVCRPADEAAFLVVHMDVPDDPRRLTAACPRDGDESEKQEERATHHRFVISSEWLPV